MNLHVAFSADDMCSKITFFQYKLKLTLYFSQCLVPDTNLQARIFNYFYFSIVITITIHKIKSEKTCQNKLGF